MFWRQPQPVPELPLSRDDVLAIFMALSDIKRWTLDILAILEQEEEDDES